MNNFVFLVMAIGLVIIVYIILTFMDRRQLHHQWNSYIESECNYQNETDRAFRNITSLQSAWVCQNGRVREIHRTIFLSHDRLLNRTEEYFKAMIECAEETSRDIPSGSNKVGIRYFPFILDRHTTGLVETFGLTDIRTSAFNLGLLILEPGTKTLWRRDASRGTYRYHYGLKIPSTGEYGLHLRDRPDIEMKEEAPFHRIKWKAKQGFIWDPTLEHYLANNSSEPCFLLVADLPRILSFKYEWINLLLHTYFPPNTS